MDYVSEQIATFTIVGQEKKLLELILNDRQIRSRRPVPGSSKRKRRNPDRSIARGWYTFYVSLLVRQARPIRYHHLADLVPRGHLGVTVVVLATIHVVNRRSFLYFLDKFLRIEHGRTITVIAVTTLARRLFFSFRSIVPVRFRSVLLSTFRFYTYETFYGKNRCQRRIGAGGGGRVCAAEGREETEEESRNDSREDRTESNVI